MSNTIIFPYGNFDAGPQATDTPTPHEPLPHPRRLADPCVFTRVNLTLTGGGGYTVFKIWSLNRRNVQPLYRPTFRSLRKGKRVKLNSPTPLGRPLGRRNHKLREGTCIYWKRGPTEGRGSRGNDKTGRITARLRRDGERIMHVPS